MKKVFLLFILISFIQCESTDDRAGLQFDAQAFRTNREMWQQNNIPDYAFSQEYFSNSVGGQPKLRSVIVNNMVDTIYIEQINYNHPIEGLTYYEKIDDVYDFIADMVANCTEEIQSDSNMKGALIDVEYDDTHYFPTQIRCSGYYPEGVLGGLSIQIYLSDFEVN